MAKADLELAVLKAQTSSPLTSTEMLELLDADFGKLMLEFDLDRVQVEHVLMWRKSEALRWQHQLVSFPEPLSESRRTRRLTISGLNRIIRKA